ncbi:hypothetical protein [Neotabrizicola sp. VNH66]|uniref:hypothetical protein n=1 Tax=Neotabrizicola sp. VNH66 TaxID=3400918 RepID=UPI003C08A7E4
MKRDMGLMIRLAQQAADPRFGAHLLLLRDAGYLDEFNQLTETGRAFVAGAEAAGMGKPCATAGLFEALNEGAKRGQAITFLR